jgi:cell division protein ZapA
MAETVKIRVKDREYAITGSDDKEQILKVAEYVDQRLREIGDSQKGLPDDKAAILTALDIAGDYFQLIKEKEVLLAEINDRTGRLIENINTALS